MPAHTKTWKLPRQCVVDLVILHIQGKVAKHWAWQLLCSYTDYAIILYLPLNMKTTILSEMSAN